MDWTLIHNVLMWIQRSVSFVGVLIILSGIVAAIWQYLSFFMKGMITTETVKLNVIRLNLGRILILGLEFIVAADLIGTTTTPDYYALGILGIIVAIRTVLNFSLNRELMSLSKEQ